MAEYLKLVGTLLIDFQKVKVSQISRGQNSHADSLVTLASSIDDYVLRLILVEVLKQPSIEQQLKVSVVSTPNPSWMDLIVAFITDGVLLNETKEAEKIQRTSAPFWLSRDKRLFDYYLGVRICCAFTLRRWMVT